MSFTLRQHGHGTSGFGDFNNSAALSIGSTTAGDCIVVALQASDRNGTAAPSPSGLGATWTTYTVGNTPMLVVCVGFNCAAGQTGGTIDGLVFSNGVFAWGVFGGVGQTSACIVGTAQGSSGSSNVQTETTGSLSYYSGLLVVGAGGYGLDGANGATAWSTGVWSDGATNHNIESFMGTSGATEGATLDYQLPSSSSSTTYTASVGTGTAKPMRSFEIALGASSGDDMLLMFGL